MHELFSDEGLEQVWDWCRREKIEAALVGGAVRDRLLGRFTKDLDLVVPEGAFERARQLADQLGATFVPLDREREIARVVLSDGSWLDFALQVGSSLEEDLANRDFTVNALAFHPERGLVDPLGGTQDLEARTLRPCGPNSLANDPLRSLRAIRMVTKYGFSLEPFLESQLAESVDRLTRVSMERVREEWFQILEAGVTPVLETLLATGLLFFLYPELRECQGCEQNYYHHLDVLAHTFEVVRGLERFRDRTWADFCPWESAIEAHFQESLVEGRSRWALLVFAAFLHDIGKPSTQTRGRSGRLHFKGHEMVGAERAPAVAQRFLLSRRESRYLEKLIRHHLIPVVAPSRQAGPRELYRFFEAAGSLAPDLLIHSRADVLATLGPAQNEFSLEAHRMFVSEMLEQYFEQGRLAAPPLPLSGEDLMAELGLQPGPMIGHLLHKLREESAVKPFQDRAQALAAAARLI